MNVDRSKFNYAADIYGAKNADGRYNVYHLTGTPLPYTSSGTPVDDSGLSLGCLLYTSLDPLKRLFIAEFHIALPSGRKPYA